MSENTRALTRAIYTFDAVVKRVPQDAWSTPSPCDGWSVLDVLGHQCGVLDALAQLLNTGERVFPENAQVTGDPLARWITTRDGVLEAIDTSPHLDKEGKWWFGEMTLDGLVGYVIWDPLTHAFDVGSVTGVASHLPTDLAQQSLERATALAPVLRKNGLIGDEASVAADADVVDRFLAFVGRQP